jgi:hypothetical protein
MASFTPTITSRRATSFEQANAGEILDSHSDLRWRRWHPANSGGAPFRQPCPACPSTKGWKAPQARFSEESFRTRTAIRKRKLHCKSAANTPTQKNSQRTASLDELAEPIYYSKRLETSSTRVFASQPMDRRRRPFPSQPLLIPPPPFTLQVFHFMIGRLRVLSERAGFGLTLKIRDSKRGAWLGCARIGGCGWS